MRVLFATHNFPRFSGDLPGNFLHRLAVALGAAGVDVSVVAPHAPGLAPADVVDGVPVTRFRYAPDDRETLAYGGVMAAEVQKSWRAKFDMLGFVRAMSAAIRESDADVVHAHWWFPAGLAAGRTALRGRPLVVTMHGSDVRFARGALPRTLMRHVLRRASRTTAVSRWLASEAAALAGVPQQPLVAPMPVDTTLFAAGTAAREGVLFVGKLDAQKGAAVLLEALAHVDRSVIATFIGGGPEADALRARTAELGLNARVRWLGPLPHSQLAPFYQSARITVAPATEAEGLGLSVAESMLCETPVIASDIGGLTDLVVDQVTGRLVPPRDPRALAAAISDALADPDRLAAWGTAGRERVLQRFDPAACAAAYVRVYEEALRGRA